MGDVCSSWAVGHSRLTSEELFQRAAYQFGLVSKFNWAVRHEELSVGCQLGK